MTNTYSPYDPIWYAQEALIQLEKALGLAARVHRGYDSRPQNLGSVIQVRTPGVFTAANAPASTVQDLVPQTVQITLNKWKEVRFLVTDQQLAYTGEQIINDHIRPAAYAIADAIDQDLVALAYAAGNCTTKTGGTMAVEDILAARKALFNAKCPLDPGMLHAMIDGTEEADLLALSNFSQFTGAGQVGVDTQLRGTLGTRYGFEFFTNQNYYSHTPGTAADVAAAMDCTVSLPAGTTQLVLKSYEASGTIKKGDLITITGDNTGNYVVTDTTATASGGGITINIEPGLRQAVLDDAVVTATLCGGSGAAAHPQALFFHKNWACLAMAPLTTLPRELGALVETVTDPVTGLSIRSRMFYDGPNSQVYVGLDVLYGVKVLDVRLGCRVPYLS